MIMNKALLSTCVNLFVRFLFSQVNTWRWLDRVINPCLIWDPASCLVKSWYHLTFSPVAYESPGAPHPPQSLQRSIFYLHPPKSVCWCLFMVPPPISLVPNDVEHVFWVCYPYSFFDKMSVQISCPFSLGLFIFLALSQVLSLLQIPNPLADSDLQTFPLVCVLSFHSLSDTFQRAEDFHLNEVCWSVCSLMDSYWCVWENIT